MANDLIIKCVSQAKINLSDPITFDTAIDEIMAAATKETLQRPDDFNNVFINLMQELREDMAGDVIAGEAQIASSLRARESYEQSINMFIGQGKRPLLALTEATRTKADAVGLAQRQALDRFHTDIQALNKKTGKNMLKWLDSPENEVAIMTEIGELNKTVGANTGVSGSKEAVAIAEIFQRRYVDPARSKLAENGQRIESVEGYMAKVSANPDTMLAATKEKFIADLKGRVNKAKVFPKKQYANDSDVEAFLSNYFDGRTGGDLSDIPLSRVDLKRQRVAPVGKRLDRKRTLYLNTAEDYVWFMRNYGNNTVASTLVETVSNVYRTLSLVEQFGATPRNTLAHAEQIAKAQATETERAAIDTPGFWNSLGGRTPEQILETVDGSADYGGSLSAKRVTNIVNMGTRAALLGGTLLSAAGDLSTAFSAASRVGASGTANIVRLISAAVGGIPEVTARQTYGIVDSANAYYIGQLFNQRIVNAGGVGVTSNATAGAVNLTMKLGLVNWWTRVGKGASATTYLRLSGENISQNWDELDFSYRMTLLRGGVTPQDWAAINAAGIDNLKAADSESLMLDIDRVKDIPDEIIANTVLRNKSSSKRQINNARYEMGERLKLALRGYVNDAIVTPDSRTKALLRFRQTDGTVVGSITSMTTNLLSYPTAYMIQAMGRELERPGGGKYSGMIVLTVGAILSGYIGGMLKDLSRGRVRDWLSDDPEQQFNNFIEAASVGGFGGHLGGMIASKVLYGEGPSSILGGGAPMSVMDSLANTAYNASVLAFDGEYDEALAKVITGTRPLIPLTNLPYTRFPIDEFVTRPLLDAVGSDAYNRSDDRFTERTGGRRIFE